MTTTYWIHIGLHKTGTTFLQRYFASHSEWLHDRGFVFPETGFHNPANPTSEFASQGHAGLVRVFKNPGSGEARELLFRLDQEVKAAKVRNVLLSSEVFSAPHNQDFCAKGVKSIVGADSDWRVVVYLRRQDLWLESFYREVLGWKGRRETRDITTFLKEEGLDWLDYPERLRPWIEAAGKDRMIVRSYDDAMAGPGILGDLLECLGLTKLSPPHDFGDVTINPSLDPSLIGLMRAINTHAELSKEGKGEITRLLLASGTDSPARGSLVDEALWRQIADRFVETNVRLANELISGRHENFLFPVQRAPTPVVRQVFEFEMAREFLEAFRSEAPESVADKAVSAPGGSFGVVATLRESPQQTREFINYHLNLGASHVVLSFDNPDDPVIAEYQHDPRMTCISCTEAHWQQLLGRQPKTMAEKLSASKRFGHERLRDMGVEWTLALDADELLFSKKDPREILAQVDDNVDLLIVRPAESIQHPEMHSKRTFASMYFKILLPQETTAGWRRKWKRRIDGTARATIKNRVGALLLARRTQGVDRAGGFLGHIEGRFFLRSDVQVERYRSHSVELQHSSQGNRRDDERRKVILDSISLLHFDCISYESWRHKWWRRVFGTTRAVNIGVKRKLQEDSIRKAMEGGEDEFRKLYLRWWWWSPMQLRLGVRTGLLKRFDIPDTMFARPVAMETIVPSDETTTSDAAICSSAGSNAAK